MKIKTVKLVSTKELQQLADEYGISYEALNESIKTQCKVLEKEKDTIKSFAAKHGKKVAKSKVVIGKKFVVGFSKVEFAPELNQARALKLLPEKILDEVVYRPRMIDETALMKLVAQKKVKKNLFLSLLDQKKSSERILVKTVQKFYEDKEIFE